MVSGIRAVTREPMAERMSRRKHWRFRCSVTGCELRAGRSGGGRRRFGANKTDPRSGYNKYQIMRTGGDMDAAYCPMCEFVSPRWKDQQRRE